MASTCEQPAVDAARLDELALVPGDLLSPYACERSVQDTSKALDLKSYFNSSIRFPAKSASPVS